MAADAMERQAGHFGRVVRLASSPLAPLLLPLLYKHPPLPHQLGDRFSHVGTGQFQRDEVGHPGGGAEVPLPRLPLDHALPGGEGRARELAVEPVGPVGLVPHQPHVPRPDGRVEGAVVAQARQLLDPDQSVEAGVQLEGVPVVVDPAAVDQDHAAEVGGDVEVQVLAPGQALLGPEAERLGWALPQRGAPPPTARPLDGHLADQKRLRWVDSKDGPLGGQP
mmetsp:Transcript_75207/g.132949  ORF Transcript_75207/g.132949 Transcript_75207/m.132949 type:complete len:222 (+) Transcript_75207:879-1544(+)